MKPETARSLLDAWKETARFWTRHRHTIRTMFAPLTVALIERAQIHEGQRVLDIAGGAGEPSLTIAGLIAPTGSVTYTDAVAEMMEAAQSEAKERGLTNVEFFQCTGDSLPFPDNSFDVVVCRLGVMLFPDPLSALREMLRVLKPEGRVALAVWHKSELNPFCYVITDIMDRHLAPVATDPEAPGAFRFAAAGKLSQMMKEAGASEAEESVLRFDIAAPLTKGEFWDMRSQTSDTLREKLARLSADERSEIAAEIEAALQEFFPSNQMKFPAQMIVASGSKPA